MPVKMADFLFGQKYFSKLIPGYIDETYESCIFKGFWSHDLAYGGPMEPPGRTYTQSCFTRCEMFWGIFRPQNIGLFQQKKHFN